MFPFPQVLNTSLPSRLPTPRGVFPPDLIPRGPASTRYVNVFFFSGGDPMLVPQNCTEVPFLVEILHFSYCSRWHLCGLWRTLGIVHRFSHCSSQSARCMFLVLRPIRDSTSLRNTFVRPSLTAVGRYMTVSTAMEAVYPCFVPPLVSCFVTICITHLIA